MKRTLPPLNGLRAFEAAARHMSFTDAAEELSVTQAAISHQVRGLEQRLGLKLFVRRNRSLLLSEAGQAYLPSVRAAFDQLNEATEKLLQKDRGGHLTVTTTSRARTSISASGTAAASGPIWWPSAWSARTSCRSARHR